MRGDQVIIPGVARTLDGHLGRHRRGHGDPSHRRVGVVWWRASTTPEGPALVRFAPDGDDVSVQAWGDGAAWALAQSPRLLGDGDDLTQIADDHALRTHALVGPLAKRHLAPIGRSDLLTESLAPAVIEQKVTGAEAFRAFRLLVRGHGTPAPGPAELADHPAAGMVCPPDAAGWAAIASWEYLRAGVEQKRAMTLVRAMGRMGALTRLQAKTVQAKTLQATTLQATTSDDGPAGRAAMTTALQTLPGIGPWTAAMVAQTALGDPDAWSVDDYHVPGFICLALTGTKGDSRAAEEALAPFAGHRYRVERLLSHSGVRVERHGPRRTLPTHLP